jgi:hypothetical protein
MAALPRKDGDVNDEGVGKRDGIPNSGRSSVGKDGLAGGDDRPGEDREARNDSADAGLAAGVIVGPSRRLPWPLDVLARRSWDEASLWYRRYRHALPITLAQAVGESVERAQRPRLGLWRSAAGAGTRLLVATNDALLRASLFDAFGTGAAEPAGSAARADLGPDTRLDADLVALDIPTRSASAFAKAGWLILPRWVAMEVDLEEPERLLWDARKRETVRRIERSHLELEVTRGSAAAREFHEFLYAPTARARHRDLAIVMRRGHVEAAARSGRVLFVRDGGVRTAGLVVVPRSGRARTLEALMFGVREGDYRATRLAREAMYLFAIRWARDVFGARRFGLTAAAPLVRDGILRFKSRWGASASADPRQAHCVAVRIQAASPELCRALVEHPLIALRQQNGRMSLSALGFGSNDEPSPEVRATRGVDIVDLRFQSPLDVPRLVDAFARDI